MASPANQTHASDIDAALSQEFVRNFQQDADRLMEILGLTGVEVRPAGRALYVYEVTGELNDSATDESSSGKAYKEGDLVALSKYKVEKKFLAELEAFPYRKQTSYKAILDEGYEGAVMKTDNKLRSQIRKAQIGDFFDFLQKGTGKASSERLQQALAHGDAALQNSMEDNGDDSDSKILHFVNRNDAADYLGNAQISMQNLFGMTYLENFLGVTDVFLTNRVPAGTVVITPSDNIRPYTVDFSALSRGGLVYQTESRGVIGVAHKGAYDYASAETNVLVGLQLIPEVLDYIVISTFGEPEEEDEPRAYPTGEPSDEWTKAQLLAYCDDNNITATESMTKEQILTAISSAG